MLDVDPGTRQQQQKRKLFPDDKEENDCIGRLLSASDDSEHYDEDFMAKYDDQQDEEEVTLSDLQQNLRGYYVKRLRKLVALLIDSIIETTFEKDIMNNNLYIHHEKRVALIDQVAVAKEKLIVLEVENLELKKKLKVFSEKSSIGKGEASIMQMELKASLNTTETKLSMALDRNNQLEKDLVRNKEKLNKSLKWATSSKLLSNLTIQGQNERIGLGNSSKGPCNNLHNKNMYVLENLLCFHCGRDGHLKKDCTDCRRTQDNVAKSSEQRNKKRK